MTMTRTIAAAVLSLVAFAPSARADEAASAATPAPMTVPRPGMFTRPRILPALYTSYAALQAYDVYSTRQALAVGAREGNPLMQGVVGNASGFVALKASMAAGTILAAERLWKNDRKAAAIGVMIASNAVSALVAGRNARALRQVR